jgi:hypothetical protein
MMGSVNVPSIPADLSDQEPDDGETVRRPQDRLECEGGDEPGHGLDLDAGAPTVAQEPKAAHKTQGAGIKIVLERDFIEKFGDRVTIETDYVVDRVSPVHPQSADGEVHIVGRGTEVALPTVAELTNPHPMDVTLFDDLARKDDPDDRKVHLQGVWRLWCEHAGTHDQVQGATLPPPPFPTSNPDHVFEIHPITKFNNLSLLDTFKPVPGFEPKPADRAFLAYENTPCHISQAGSKVTIATRVVGFNFVEFILSPWDEHPQFALPDGRFVMCQVFDTDGELVARRMAFVQGTTPEEKVKALNAGGRLHVIGIPRINLRRVKWRLDHANDPNFDKPLEWDLPYEIVVLALVKELPAGGDD